MARSAKNETSASSEAPLCKFIPSVRKRGKDFAGRKVTTRDELSLHSKGLEKDKVRGKEKKRGI